MKINLLKLLEMACTSELVLGRESNEIELSHPTVSRKHAVLHRLGARDVMITDLESANGVFVNGEKVKKALLVHGDVVTLGDVSFEVTVEPEESEESDWVRSLGEWISASPSIKNRMGW